MDTPATSSPAALFNAMYYGAGNLVQSSLPFFYAVFGILLAVLASVLIAQAFKFGANKIIKGRKSIN